MNYKKYLFIILAVLLGTVPSFAYQLAKADSVIVNTTDSASAAATAQVSPLTTDSVADKKAEPEKVEKKKEKKAEKKGEKKEKKKDDKKTSVIKQNKKWDTPEWKAKRQAASIAMDSIIFLVRKQNLITQDHLQAFADHVCEQYEWDPELMISFATSFFAYYDNIQGEKRFSQIKQRYPNYVKPYYSFGKYLHDLAWLNSDGTTYNPEFLAKAKVQIDSAKLIVPDSPEPYMLWIRWQGKYDPEGISAEVDTLKMRIPNYPGWLKVARDFDYYAEKDRMFLLSAKKSYGKAERDSMQYYDYQNYALVCYRVGEIQKKVEDFQEGIDIANEGLKKFPEMPGLIRMKLWNQADRTNLLPNETKEDRAILKAQWDSTLVTAKQFEALPDTIKRLADDYKWLAIVNMETKNHSTAIKYFKKQLEAGITDSIQHARTLRNILECYTDLELYENAVEAFNEYRDYKEGKGMELTLFDYSKLLNVYNYQGADTLSMPNERMESFHKADSILEIMITLDSTRVGYVNNMRLGVAMQIVQVSEGGELKVQRPEILEASQRLYRSILAIPEANRTANDWYYMIRGLRFAMEHYIQNDQHGETWICADTMLGMPMSMELPDLSSGRKKEYDSHSARAEQVIGIATYANAGKKLKKQGFKL